MKRLMAAVALLMIIPALRCGAADLIDAEYVPKSEKSAIFYVDVSGSCDVSAAVFELTFDSRLVSYEGIAASAASSSVRGRETDGKVRIAFADSGAVRGRMFRLTFKAIEKGTVGFVLHTVQAVDERMKALSPDDCTLTVTLGESDDADSSSQKNAVSRSAGGASSSVKNGVSSRGAGASSQKSRSAGNAGKSSRLIKAGKTGKNTGKHTDTEEDESETNRDAPYAVDLRRSDSGKWLMIGAGIPVLIAALVFLGVMIGKRTSRPEKSAEEKPGNEPDPEPDDEADHP